MKKIIAAVALVCAASTASAECLFEGDTAKDAEGNIGVVSNAHCDLDGYEAYTLVYADGSTKLFESAPEAPGYLPEKDQDVANQNL